MNGFGTWDAQSAGPLWNRRRGFPAI